MTENWENLFQKVFNEVLRLASLSTEVHSNPAHHFDSSPGENHFLENSPAKFEEYSFPGWASLITLENLWIKLIFIGCKWQGI